MTAKYAANKAKDYAEMHPAEFRPVVVIGGAVFHGPFCERESQAKQYLEIAAKKDIGGFVVCDRSAVVE